RKMIFAPRYGMPGVFGLGYFFVFDAVGPFIELLGFIIIPSCWIAGVLNTQFFMAFMGLLFMFGVFVSVGSLFMEEITCTEKTPPALFALLSSLRFHQKFRLPPVEQFLAHRRLVAVSSEKERLGDDDAHGLLQSPAGGNAEDLR